MCMSAPLPGYRSTTPIVPARSPAVAVDLFVALGGRLVQMRGAQEAKAGPALTKINRTPPPPPHPRGRRARVGAGASGLPLPSQSVLGGIAAAGLRAAGSDPRRSAYNEMQPIPPYPPVTPRCPPRSP